MARKTHTDQFKRDAVKLMTEQGYSLSKALAAALMREHPGPGLIHHSDRGSQYTSGDFQHLLSANGITCSMSR